MTTINDIADLVRIIREQPEWADTLRGILLGRELLELPERFARFVEATERNFEVVNARLEQLEAGQQQLEAGQQRLETELVDFKDSVNRRLDRMDGRLDRMDGRMDRMDGRMDNALGTLYELHIGKNLQSIAGQKLGLRSARVLHGSPTGSDLPFLRRSESAVDRGLITWEQHDLLWNADFIVTGRSRADGTPVQAVGEASITAGNDDIDRAQERADILAALTGQPATPVVVCANIDDERERRARDQGVTVVLAPQ